MNVRRRRSRINPHPHSQRTGRNRIGRASHPRGTNVRRRRSRIDPRQHHQRTGRKRTGRASHPRGTNVRRWRSRINPRQRSQRTGRNRTGTSPSRMHKLLLSRACHRARRPLQSRGSRRDRLRPSSRKRKRPSRNNKRRRSGGRNRTSLRVNRDSTGCHLSPCQDAPFSIGARSRYRRSAAFRLLQVDGQTGR